MARLLRHRRTFPSWIVAAILLVAHVAHAGVKDGVEQPGAEAPAGATGPPATPRVAEVLINFDDVVAPCVFALTTSLRDPYLASGARFTGSAGTDGGAILNWCGNFSVTGYSGDNFLAFNGGLTHELTYNPALPQAIVFTSPVVAVSIRVGSGSGAGFPVELHAFDAANVLVDSDSRILTPELQLLSVSATSISRVIVSGPEVMVLDDLRFTPGGIVPALATSWGRVKAIYR